MMNDNELKPCPFCGGEAHCDRHDIFCDCGEKIEIPLYVIGSTSVGVFPTYEEAIQMMIETWNNRADDNLISRQKAEIDKLKLTYSLKIGEVQEHYRNQIGKARANAIKEFAAKIKTHKRRLCGNDNGGLYWDQAVLVDDIDRVLKEMTEDKE